MKPKGILVVLTLALLAACGGGDGSDAQPSDSPGGDRPRSTGQITIVSPKTGMVYAGDDVPVKIELTGARLLEKASTDVRPDTGHMHLKLDGKTVTLLAGLEVQLADLTSKPIEPGVHRLEAEFAASDHYPFNPRVVQTVVFRTS